MDSNKKGMLEGIPYKFEICANSVASCIAAQEGGADRVELCAGIPEGGTTPSYGMIKSARESISIGLNVIIRPRGGDFLYTEEELREMVYDIKMAKELGADGLVFGCLRPDGNVDMEAMKTLIVLPSGSPSRASIVRCSILRFPLRISSKTMSILSFGAVAKNPRWPELMPTTGITAPSNRWTPASSVPSPP